MNFEEISGYLAIVLMVFFFAWRSVRSKRTKGQLGQWVNEGAVIVDVRSPAEYQQGSRQGSLNIPLDELGTRFKELDRDKPVILCCASGARSGRALQILQGHGFKKVINGGPWGNTPPI